MANQNIQDGNKNDVDAAAIEAGRQLFTQESRFIVSASEMANLPPEGLPEIAFAGRSNVGKSSLINKLTQRSDLARTSNTPGRTRLLNFFSLGERLALVDLPGYGYAKAPKSNVTAWIKLTEAFLRGRPSLRRVCLLIDARRGVKDVDETAMQGLDTHAVSYLVVLTKIDKLKEGELAKITDRLTVELKRHVAAYPEIIATSAETGEGIPALRAHLATLAVPA